MILDILSVAILTAWAAVVGRAVVGRLGGLGGNRSDDLALAVPVGLGLLALAALGLGEIGRLDRGGIGAVLFLMMGAAWWGRPREAIEAETEPKAAAGPLGIAMNLALGACLAGTFLTALTPVTDGDALCYHLQVPKVFLAARSVTFEPDLHETVYPLVTEMLYSVALAFRGATACRLVQWVLGVVFAANVARLARPVLEPKAWWAGTVALAVPAVSNGMGAPLNDVALAAFANAALAAVILVRDRPSVRRVILAGGLAGLALGVKYPALPWVGVLGVALVIDGRSGEWGRKLRTLAIFGAVAAIVGGGWYLRAYGHTGNPVYPFFREFFGGAGIADVLDPIKRPMKVSVVNLLTALGPMTLDPDRFDSVSHQFGPAFLLFLPGLALLKPPGRVVFLVAVGFAFLTICLTQRQSMRFVLAAVGPFSVGVAWAVSAWRERGGIAARLISGALVAVLVFETGIAVGRARHGLKVVSGRETSEAFLDRREPTYRVGRWIDGHLGPEARIIGQEHRGFYLPRPYTMELAHRRRTGLGTKEESAEAIVATLRERGFTHLLVCPPDPEDAVEFDGLLTRKLAPWLAGQTPIYESRIVDPDGVARRYAILDLDPRVRR